jgi:uncharacterized membrane protein YeiH
VIELAAIGKFQFPLMLEIIAPLVWAVGGAIVARTRDFDFTGVFVMAVANGRAEGT